MKRTIISLFMTVTLIITSAVMAIPASARALGTQIYVGEQVYLTNWTGNAVTVSSFDNGANVTMDKLTGRKTQVFEIDYKDGYVMFKNPASGKYLEVRNSGTSDGDVVGLWQDNGQLCARWYITQYEDGMYGFINANSGLYMNVSGNSSSRGAQVQQYHEDGTTAVRFDLISVDAAPPSASISFSDMVVPTAITKGSAFSLGGTISVSNGTLLRITGEILNSSGRTIQSKSIYTSKTSYRLTGSTIDVNLKFGRLDVGNYTLKYTVYASDGTSKQSENYSFAVINNETVIDFVDPVVPNNVLKGSPFYLGGTVKVTNGNLYRIDGSIINVSGSTLQSKTAYISGTSYRIASSTIDANLKFGQLDNGNYTLRYVIYAADGTSKTYDYPFMIYTNKTPQNIWGDVNGDGKFSITDIVQVQSYIDGSRESLNNKSMGDVDQNGIINSDDLEYLNKALANNEVYPMPTTYSGNRIVVFQATANAQNIYGSQQVLDVYGGYSNDESLIALYGYSGEKDNQMFEMQPLDRDYYVIKSVYCDKVWDINGNPSSSQYRKLQLFTNHGGNNEIYKEYRNSDGTYSYVTKDGYIIEFDTITGAVSANVKYSGAGSIVSTNKFWTITFRYSDGSSYSTEVPSGKTASDFDISDNGVAFICGLEGFSSTCYPDYSQSSIGYGTKCKGCSEQPHEAGLHTITREQALIDMKTQISNTYAPRVRRQMNGIAMTQSQFDALVSLCYNTGGGNSIISDSPLAKYLTGELSESEARYAYSNYYVKAGGSVLQGLINRRNKEADLFFTK